MPKSVGRLAEDDAVTILTTAKNLLQKHDYKTDRALEFYEKVWEELGIGKVRNPAMWLSYFTCVEHNLGCLLKTAKLKQAVQLLRSYLIGIGDCDLAAYLACKIYGIAISIKLQDWDDMLAFLEQESASILPTSFSEKHVSLERAFDLLIKALSGVNDEVKSHHRLLGEYLLEKLPFIESIAIFSDLLADYYILIVRLLFDPTNHSCTSVCLSILWKTTRIIANKRRRWLGNLFFNIGLRLAKQDLKDLSAPVLKQSLELYESDIADLPEVEMNGARKEYLRRLLIFCELLAKSNEQNEITSIIRSKIILLDISDLAVDMNLQKLVNMYAKFCISEGDYRSLFSLFPSWNQPVLLELEKKAFEKLGKLTDKSLAAYLDILKNILENQKIRSSSDHRYWADCAELWVSFCADIERGEECFGFLKKSLNEIAGREIILSFETPKYVKDCVPMDDFAFICYVIATNNICSDENCPIYLNLSAELWVSYFKKFGAFPQLATCERLWHLSNILEKHGLYRPALSVQQMFFLNNQIKKTGFKDRFEVLQRLSRNCLRLGDERMAEKHCTESIAEAELDHWAALKARLSYADFLCSIDDANRSEQIFLSIVWPAANQEKEQRSVTVVYCRAFAFYIKAKIFDSLGLLGAALENFEHSFRIVSAFPSIINDWEVLELLLNIHFKIGFLNYRRGTIKQALHFLTSGLEMSRKRGFVFYEKLFHLHLDLINYQIDMPDRVSDSPIQSTDYYSNLAFASLDLCQMFLANASVFHLKGDSRIALDWIERADKCVEFLHKRISSPKTQNDRGSKKNNFKLIIHIKTHIQLKRTLVASGVQARRLTIDETLFYFTMERAEDFYASGKLELQKTTKRLVSATRSAFKLALSDLQNCLSISYLSSPPFLYRSACDQLARCVPQFPDNCLIFHLENGKSLTYQREILCLLRKKALRDTLYWPADSFENDQAHSLENWFGTLYRKYSLCMHESIQAFTTEITGCLPDYWRVISVTMNQDKNGAYFVIFTARRPPLIVFKQFDSDFNLIRSRFENILVKNDQISREGPSCKQKIDKAKWWSSRKALDNELFQTIVDLERSLVGFLECLFTMGVAPPETVSTFRDQLEKILQRFLPKQKISPGRLVTSEWAELIYLTIRSGSKGKEHILRVFLSSLPHNVSDRLQKLASRIEDSIQLKCDAVSGEAFLQASWENILILDKDLQRFPWESFPLLRGRSVCRLPSLNFLRDRLLSFAMEPEPYLLSRSNISYVLNPSGDLLNTQARFESILSKPGWSGTIGRPPSESEMRDYLTKSDALLYFGHSAGEQYLKGSRIRELDRCAVSLLFGCSSGKLKCFGDFDPVGIPIDYLMAGSLSIVANLWDVTDKDIDKLSEAALKNWGIFSDRRISLSAAIAESRGVPVLKNLTGAAPVVYGIPVRLR